MPMPNLTDAQNVGIVKQVEAYIERQHQTYRRTAVPLTLNQLVSMRPFFPVATLDAARLIAAPGERVNNPPFYGELIRMGFDARSLPDFAHMAAITFVDTVVSHEPFTERLLFHELVHVVQYEKLGLSEFSGKVKLCFVN